MIKFNLTFPDLIKRLESSEDRITTFMAATIQTNRGMLFDQEGAYNGHEKWAPLKYRIGHILSRSGILRKSIAPLGGNGKAGPNGFVEVKGTKATPLVRVGTLVKYAAMMNWGTTGLPNGVLVPRKKSVLRFPIGERYVFATKVKIPARRFDEWNDQDQAELVEGMTNLLVAILRGE